jgi:hypothetical protein
MKVFFGLLIFAYETFADHMEVWVIVNEYEHNFL